jgi:5-formyltetrahydrofolate cyclo-ligase
MIQASPASAKQLLRVEMRARRRALAMEQLRAGALAAQNLPIDRLPPFEVVSGYVPHNSEIDPGPVLNRFRAAGARIALPAAVELDGPLVFRAWTPQVEWVPDAADIRAPNALSQELIPQIIVTPLLAFDRKGGRLGQGGGHFDRTLAALDAAGPVFALGIAFAGQEVASVPGEHHDRPLDAILTDKEYIEIARP